MPRTNDVDCEHVRSLIPAYSIGATDPDETRVVEQGLITCPQAAAELAEYLALAQALHYTRPPRIPARHQLPTVPATVRSTADPRPRRLPQTPARRPFPWVAVAAALLLLVVGGVNLFLLAQLNQVRQEQQQLIALISVNQDSSGNSAVLIAEDVKHRTLQPTTAGTTDTEVILIWNEAVNIGTLYAQGLQPLPPEMTYQLWLVRDNATVSLGTFDVDASGTGTLIFQSQEPIDGFQVAGISPEPAHGSTIPTHEHVAIGEI